MGVKRGGERGRSERISEERTAQTSQFDERYKTTLVSFPGASGAKNPARAGDVRQQVQSLGWKDPLEKEVATYSSTLAWERGAWQATVHEVTKELDATY